MMAFLNSSKSTRILHFQSYYRFATLRWKTTKIEVNVNVLAKKQHPPNCVQFRKAQYGVYELQPPQLENQYTGNAFMQRYLKNHLPSQIFAEINDDLTQLGHRVATDIHQTMLECEANLPYLRQNAWGQNAAELIVSDAWNRQRQISIEERLVSTGYNRAKYGQFARLYQHAKLFLYNPSSGSYGCPLAMTDGAAKSFETLGLLKDPKFAEIYQRLLSNDSKQFWTSGQWMTEKGGGSDVAGGTETIAVPQSEPNQYKLYGFKWFSSATDANMALTLARIAEPSGNVTPGTEGITLFYLPVKQVNGRLNENINLVKLKNKMGTKPLPTAELLLDGALATKISEEGRGIASIASMLQITRMHNATASAGYIWRFLSLARDYAQRREAFGRKIINWPLHAISLAKTDLISKATLVFAFENARLLGLIENNMATDEEKLLFRILSPLAKLYNAKIGLINASDGMEAIGGQAVMEDTGIPYLYRDGPIASIWEGTTSVLSLDVLRSIIKSNGKTIFAFKSNLKNRLEPLLNHSKLGSTSATILAHLEKILSIGENEPKLLALGARDFAFSLSNLFVAGLLLQHSVSKNAIEQMDQLTALRFCNMPDLVPFLRNYKLGEYSEENKALNVQLVMDGYKSN